MKSRLKRRILTGLAILTTWGVGLGILSGCNQDEAGQGINNGGNPQVPPVAITYAISEIYDSNAASLYFDAQQQATDAVNALAKQAWGDDANVVAVCDMGNGTAGIVGDDGGLLSSFVVAADGDVVGFYNGSKNIKEETIAGAGFSPDDKAKPEQKEEVLQKLQAAKEAIQAEIAAFKDANPQITNIYDTVVDLGDGKFLGGIFGVGAWARAFVWRVDEEGLTKEEIEFFEPSDGPFDIDKFTELYLRGVYTSITSPTRVSPDEPYEYNPVEPNPPEVVGFEEIFNQIFGEDYDVPTCESVLDKILSTAIPNGKNLKLICADISSDNLKFYTEGVNNLGRTVFSEVEYLGNNGETISAYLNILKEIGEAGSLMGYAQEMCGLSGDVEEGSDEYTAVVNFLNDLQNALERGEEGITSLISKNFGSTGLINQTRETLPAPANQFGEAILKDVGENGNIIATYVGDTSIGFDQTGHFETGYLGGFKMAVVYKNGGIINIIITEVLTPSQINSPSADIYNQLIREDGRHELRSTVQISIENPVVQNQNQEAFKFTYQNLG